MKSLLPHRFGYIILVCWCSLAMPAPAEEVPATLDLVQHAKAALNAVTGMVDDRGEFMFDCKVAPPSLKHDAYSFAACGPKFVESIAMMTLMTGDDIHAPRNQKPIQYVLSCLGEDGLFYCKIGPDRPWDTSSPEDWANIYGQGRILRALLAVYQLDHDPAWPARMKKLAAKLNQIAIRKTDPTTGLTYAYYPNTPGYGDVFSYPKSGWKNTNLLTEVDKSTIGKSIADLPDHSFGIPLYIGGIIEPLTRYAQTFHDAEALELAGQLVRFEMQKDSAWKPDGHARGDIPEQNGQFYGHFHAHTLCLRGILEYAIATNDPELKQFARSGYEFARTMGIPRLGWFEEYTGKFSHETCGLANMTALAVKLSTSGVGDYWDDVDCYARNHLTQAQFTDIETFKRANKAQLDEAQIQKLSRMVGAFAGWGPPEQPTITHIMNCCTANGSQALYYVWDSIVREESGLVSVNLLLNRRSLWVDIESWLPYRGEVVLQLKKAGRLAVRVPGWVEKSAVRLQVGNASQPVVWIGNCVLVDQTKAGTQVRLQFPMKESVEHYAADSYEFRGTKYLGRHEYTITFRGDTGIGMEPKCPDGHSVYDRAFYRSESVPMMPLPAYVPPGRLVW